MNVYPYIRSACMPLRALPIARIYGCIRERYRAGETVADLALDSRLDVALVEQVVMTEETP